MTFVPSNRKKIAYAVSTGKSKLSEDDIKQIEANTYDYSAISVREEDTQIQLDNTLHERDVQLALDPTLLLDIDDWAKLSSKRKVEEPYLFCYFLGSDVRLRKIATEYGKKHSLKVICVPHMQEGIEINDIQFGDVQLFDATPQDFLSYIQYSNMVFTDSFHASVFSQIFKKQYIVFGRTEYVEMNNRLKTFTRLFNTEKNFLYKESDYNISYIEKMEPVDFKESYNEYELLKKKSISFLINSLN